MDRNSLIGFTLMALLLFVYFTFFAPQPAPPQKTIAADSLAQTNGIQTINPGEAGQPVAVDSSFTEQSTVLENKDIKITLSNRGAVITSAELKSFKAYGGGRLLLIDSGSSRFSGNAVINGVDTDIFKLPYTQSATTGTDPGKAEFTANTSGGLVKITWVLPSEGFTIQNKIEFSGARPSDRTLRFSWVNRMPLVEKDLNDSRTKTAINFYLPEDGLDGLSETSVDPENMSVPPGASWIGMKQKFFLSAVLNKTGFGKAEIGTLVDPSDDKTVKNGSVSAEVGIGNEGAVLLDFYIGPNDQNTLSAVAPGLEENVYLGWPPVKWVNAWFIVPVFRFLSSFISNYGLIIIILVIIIRIVLFPLSYKSYLGMAKMRLLKPELDEIKKKYPDDQMKFSQEQMKLFSEVGASPFAGCIPLLLQMPILFAMFYLFPSIIEFRQQTLPFAEDISTYDSVLQLPFALPFMGSHISIYTLLMTISTLAITWQNNQLSTVDGPMKSLSYIMPLVFFFVLNSFPASLSFYYLVGNVASFGQQILIKRFVDEDKIKKVMEEHRKKLAAGNSNKSPFMSRLSDALKASEEARKKSKRG